METLRNIFGTVTGVASFFIIGIPLIICVVMLVCLPFAAIHEAFTKKKK